MITSLDFDRVIYKKPFLHNKKDQVKLPNIVGIDSEAYTTGEPFMFCTSKGDTIKPHDLLSTLFSPKYLHSNFIFYNMRYDSGAILYHLPLFVLKELWKKNEAEYAGFKYKYIPKKYLSITRIRKYKKGELKDTVTFWDIAQFYKSSLDKAAQRYLDERKTDIRTKNFTPKYVKRFWKSIARYCIQDATLTAKLAQYFVDKLEELNIIATTIYSCASISAQFFINKSKPCTAYHLYNHENEIIAMACDAYEGGKFEVTGRGYLPYAVEYDITSAYPYEIRNLIDLTHARVEYNDKYRSDSDYAFYRIHIQHDGSIPIPFGPKLKNTNIYPAGSFYITITKAEIEYLRQYNIEHKIIRAGHIFANGSRKKYLYRKPIDTAFEIKSCYKGKDQMLYNTSKILMNSFYGKTCQCIENWKKEITVGQLFNPIYASVITANTRLKITNIQRQLGKHCFAVHTDSVICDRPIPSSLLKNKLGYFEKVVSGKAYIIACGMYQIGDTCAFKGFKPAQDETWESILSRFKTCKQIRRRILHVESWTEAMAKNHAINRINKFEKVPKLIKLNGDVKRLWYKQVRGKDLLDRFHDSSPLIHTENKKPDHW